MKIRTDYCIKGNLIGCIANNPRNITHSGLPAVYSSNEIQLLLENKFVTLIVKDDLKVPNESDSIEYKKQIDVIRNEQNDHSKEHKLQETRKIVDKIIHGKKNKLLKSGKAEEGNILMLK